LPKAAAEDVAGTAETGTERFSEERLAALRAEGRPVFVYFTADWCLTCKVNEKAAIERSEVTAAFKKAGVATLVGDWTRGDPAIGRFLATHGRSGVPYYLFYPADGEPRELPQVLTPSTMLELVS
jgi:thiol:disulfide interchange protein